MIKDNYLEDAITTLEDAQRALAEEISALKQRGVVAENLENVQRLLSTVDSYLLRIQEAFS